MTGMRLRWQGSIPRPGGLSVMTVLQTVAVKERTEKEKRTHLKVLRFPKTRDLRLQKRMPGHLPRGVPTRSIRYRESITPAL